MSGGTWTKGAITDVDARALQRGDEVYVKGERRVVRMVHPYRLCTVVVAEDGRRSPVNRNTRLTVWKRQL